MDKIDYIMITVIALVLGVTGLLIADISYHHYQRSHVKEEISKGWEPPVIPSCNKELWERIKDGCGDQLDEGED